MRSTTLTGLLFTAVLLGGCGISEGAPGEATGTTVTAESAPAGPKASADGVGSGSTSPAEGTGDASAEGEGATVSGGVVPDTLAFTGETIDGEAFDGTQLAGVPTVLWFWAPWCPTCRAQVSGVEAVADQFAGEVNVVGVGGLSDSDAIIDFARGVAGPTHLVDEEGAVWRHFGITAQSTFVMLDADGKVVRDGYLDNEGLEKAVAELAG